ncbi:MAG TPA: hypothetical protein VGH93_07985 [Solirubrobacteraceae bacterium]
MRKRLEKRLVDKMIDAYVDWRDACLAVNDAYREWASDTGVGAAAAFRRYLNALDNEEFAADGYARLVRRVGRVVADDRELAGLLGSQTRGAGTAGR